MHAQLAVGLYVLVCSASIAGAAQGTASPKPLQPIPSASAEKVTALDANELGRAAHQRKDYAEALRWFHVAANAGLAKAQYNVLRLDQILNKL